jgi:DNA-binding CsgD family transcriptional regulator
MNTKHNKIVELIKDGKRNKQIAKETGAAAGYVRNIRTLLIAGGEKVKVWDRFESMLGVKTDNEIADIMGITANAVTRKRLRMGIQTDVDRRHKELADWYKSTLQSAKTEVETKAGGKIDILSLDKICECKTTLNQYSALVAIGQLFLYSLDYPNHKKVILTSSVDCAGHVIRSLEKLGIELVVHNMTFICDRED